MFHPIASVISLVMVDPLGPETSTGMNQALKPVITGL